MKNLLNQLIDDFHERPFPDLLPRRQAMTRVPGKANVVIGMRRSGKTWFCFQQMRELIEGGLEKERILYLNFEDERLLPFSVEDFQLILDTYYRKFPAFKNRQCHLFLDEVQRIEGWELFVRRVLDTEQLKVCITGSSSKILSKEIATTLRGRSLTTEIFPFDFEEFLRRGNVELKSIQRIGSRMKATLQHEMGRYLDIGGFPEVQSMDDALRREVLQNYLDVVILRDVVERHSVSNTVVLRALMRHIMSSPSTRLSMNKFYNDLKSQGITCSKVNLYSYMDHLTDSFLFYQVPIHSRSERARRVNPNKVYAIDSGLLKAVSLRSGENRGALLENIVYMHLRRQGFAPEYYVTRKEGEVDFLVAPEERESRKLIQVCWDMNDPETRNRELRALLCAMNELGMNRGTVVTWLDEESPDERLDVVPVWKWLLE